MTHPAERNAVVDRLAVVGLGLIGGSVALAARRSGAAAHVVGVASHDHGDVALELGLIDSRARTIAEAVHEADLVVVATPVSIADQIFAELAPALSAKAIVTDCGSTKVSMITSARTHLAAAFNRFVPGHPIAGSERSGPRAARAALFEDKRWLFCPADPQHLTHLPMLTRFVERLGARASVVDPDEHDAMFADYSHAPHAIVFALCLAVAEGPWSQRLQELAGAGLRDTTRIGSSSPTLWADILLDNARHTVASIDRFSAAVEEIQRVIASGDRAALIELIARASAWRAGLDAANGKAG